MAKCYFENRINVALKLMMYIIWTCNEWIGVHRKVKKHRTGTYLNSTTIASFKYVSGRILINWYMQTKLKWFQILKFLNHEYYSYIITFYAQNFELLLYGPVSVLDGTTSMSYIREGPSSYPSRFLCLLQFFSRLYAHMGPTFI